MSRARGTYSTVENWVLEVAPTLSGVAGWVLLKIATQSNYKRKTMTVGQLMDALGYSTRTLDKACALLAQEGYIVCAEGEHVLRGACTKLAQGAHKARASLANQKATDKQKREVYSEIPAHNKKEEEGKEVKDKKTPPTPQGGEGLGGNGQALAVETAQAGKSTVTPQGGQGASNSPDGEAASAATASTALSQESNQSHPQSRKSNTTTSKKVPRGAGEKKRKLAAPVFDPLSITLPECVPAALWAEWVGHRRDKKKPLTERAATLTLRGLEQAHANGWDVETLVNEAIASGWTGCVWAKHRAPNPRPAHVVPFSGKPKTQQEADKRFVAHAKDTYAVVEAIFND